MKLVIFCKLLFVTTWAATAHAAADEPDLCADILYLIEQSGSDFAQIRADDRHSSAEIEVTYTLSGASRCMLSEDAEKQSYRCIWRYPIGDARAHEQFQEHLADMRRCLGVISEEREDQAVNHPDFYASRYYQLPNSLVSVSLKNKSELLRTLITIRIDNSN